MIVFECASCQKKLQVADEHAGKNIICPSCKDKATLPDKDGEETEGDTEDDRPARRKSSSTGSRPAKNESGAGKWILYIGGGITAVVMLVVVGVFCCPCLFGIFSVWLLREPKEIGQDPPPELVKKLGQERPAKAVQPQKPPEEIIPPEATLRNMATESLLDLNQAIQTKDFTAFHVKVCAALQKERTPQQMKEAFQKQIDADWEIWGVKNLRAEFDPAPAIDEKGWLVLKGRYRTKKNELIFSLSYIYEHAGWKLAVIEVEMKRAGPK